jgi:hypothetical protein
VIHQYREGRGSLSLKTIHNLFPVTKHFPEFQHASGREAIFAWDNPVGADSSSSRSPGSIWTESASAAARPSAR